MTGVDIAGDARAYFLSKCCNSYFYSPLLMTPTDLFYSSEVMIGLILDLFIDSYDSFDLLLFLVYER